jgi:hypothetical protein
VLGGMYVGCLIGLGYSAIAAVLSFTSRGSAFAELGVPLWIVVSSYLTRCTAGGAVVGFLWPYTITRIGAAAVGILGAVPLTAGIVLLDRQLFDTDGVIAAVVVAVIFGGYFGSLFLAKSQEQSNRHDA